MRVFLRIVFVTTYVNFASPRLTWDSNSPFALRNIAKVVLSALTLFAGDLDLIQAYMEAAEDPASKAAGTKPGRNMASWLQSIE